MRIKNRPVFYLSNFRRIRFFSCRPFPEKTTGAVCPFGEKAPEQAILFAAARLHLQAEKGWKKAMKKQGKVCRFDKFFRTARL
ncbi:hypothetical protein KE531_02790 [Eubacteriaceae bacterium Marseille-Q4139]|nr:hypothetical protein [Eubacteriaceae bacterium Marseille-Q4139]